MSAESRDCRGSVPACPRAADIAAAGRLFGVRLDVDRLDLTAAALGRLQRGSTAMDALELGDASPAARFDVSWD